MKCPYCGHDDSRVVDSRPTDEGSRIRRRRECISCLKRFTTFEIIETVPLMVVKKDKTRQVFDRSKLRGGLLRACANRPIPVALLEEMMDGIEAELMNGIEREVSTKVIGEMALERLWEIDKVAYVRFASVYRDFQDIETFVQEVNKLAKGQRKKNGEG